MAHAGRTASAWQTTRISTRKLHPLFCNPVAYRPRGSLVCLPYTQRVILSAPIILPEKYVLTQLFRNAVSTRKSSYTHMALFGEPHVGHSIAVYRLTVHTNTCLILSDYWIQHNTCGLLASHCGWCRALSVKCLLSLVCLLTFILTSYQTANLHPRVRRQISI